MDRNPLTFAPFLKRPSAYLPVVMSLTALVIVLVHIAIFGVAREADEAQPRTCGSF